MLSQTSWLSRAVKWENPPSGSKSFCIKGSCSESLKGKPALRSRDIVRHAGGVAAWRDNWKRASGGWLLLLIVIAVCGAQRDPNYPDAPTFKEMFGDGFVFDSVYGIVAPLKTPKDRIERLQSLIKEALSDPDVQAKFAKVNMTTNYLPADEFGKVIEGYYKLFEEPIRKAKEAEKK